MKCLKKYESYLNQIRDWYVTIFIIYLLLSRAVLFVSVISIPVNAVIYNMLAIVGFSILVWDFFTHFYQFKSLENVLLVGFLVICTISSILNVKYGIVDNLKTLVWTTIQFFLLYSMMHIKDISYIKKMLSRIMNTTCIIWFIGSVISLFQFVFVIKYRADYPGFPRRQGFIESRLFGIYSDPNFASITSLVVIVFSLFLYKNAKSKTYKRFQLTNIIVQLLYIVLSGSRTGQLELVLLGFILGYTFIRSYCIKNNIKKYYIRGIVGAILLSVLSLGASELIKIPLLEVAKFGGQIKHELFYDSDDEITDNNMNNNGANSDEEIITLDREDIKEDNISNNRIDIWKGAIEVSKEARIFGVSPRNLLPYAKEHSPDGYIALSGYETHSAYVGLLVNTGVTGVAVIGVFVAYMIYLFVNYLKAYKKKVYEDEFIICVATVILIAVSAVMLPDIFFNNSFSAGIFWLTAGYFTFLTKKVLKSEV